MLLFLSNFGGGLACTGSGCGIIIGDAGRILRGPTGTVGVGAAS